MTTADTLTKWADAIEAQRKKIKNSRQDFPPDVAEKLNDFAGLLGAMSADLSELAEQVRPQQQPQARRRRKAG